MKTFSVIRFSAFLLLLSGFFLPATAQIDHWETVINASNTWKYFPGVAEPPATWRQLGFADGGWASGPGGVGFSDGDDGTVISTVNSVYLRKTFTVVDTSQIYMALLHIDYDDGFIAFINDVEIARNNLGGVTGDHPLYSDFGIVTHEAEMYSGGAADNYYIDKATLSSILVNGNNVLAIQVHNLSGSPDLSSNAWLSFGMKNPGSTYGPVPSWFYGISTSSNLPLVRINTNGATIVDDPRVNGTMGITDNGPGLRNYLTDPFNDFFGNIDIEIRGSTSQQYPKKGYGLELHDSLGGNLNASLLGMPAENDWILYGPYPDKTLLRNELTYHVFDQLGHYSPRYRYCELYINNQYLGVYSLMEKIKIDNSRLDIPTLDADDNAGDSLTGGYILKIDKVTGSGTYSWVSPLDPDVWFIRHDPDDGLVTASQAAYIEDYVTDFEYALQGPSFADPDIGYRAYADVNSFIDFMLMQELGRTVDGYRSSSFLHKTTDSRGGKLRMGPMWDFNLSYGNANYCDSYLTAGWQYEFNIVCPGYTPHIPFWWDRFLDDPQFQNEIRCRWDYLRAGPLHTDSLHAWVDSVALHLNESMNRNFDRWPIMGVFVNWNYYVGATYADEINYLKTWLTNRTAWMDANLPTGTSICNSPGSADVSISEISYHSDSLHSSGDWVELNNRSTTVVDISGWRLKDDNATNIFTIPDGTVIQPDSFLVICQDTFRFDTTYPGVLNRIGVTTWNLDNDGDRLRLYDAVYTPVRDMWYDDLAPWPLTPDGGGYTLECLDSWADLSDGTNWIEGCEGGSPGTRLVLPCTIPVHLQSGFDAQAGLSVFPNPFSRTTTARISAALLAESGTQLSFTLTSLTGMQLMRMPVSGENTLIDCSSLPSGIYFLSLKQGQQTLTVKKLIIQ